MTLGLLLRDNTMTEHRPRSERGQLAVAGENYGSSLLGAPLLYFPAAVSGPETGLIIAGTHGDESAAIVTLSCALRSIAPIGCGTTWCWRSTPTAANWGCAPMPTASI